MAKRKYYKITEVAKMLDTTVPKIKNVLKKNGLIVRYTHSWDIIRGRVWSKPGGGITGNVPANQSDIPSDKAHRGGFAIKRPGKGKKSKGMRGPYQWNVEKIRCLLAGEEVSLYADNFTGISDQFHDEGRKYNLNIWYSTKFKSWSVTKNKRLVGKMWNPKGDKGWRLYSDYKSKREDFDMIVEGEIPHIVSCMNDLIMKSPPPEELPETSCHINDEQMDCYEDCDGCCPACS